MKRQIQILIVTAIFTTLASVALAQADPPTAFTYHGSLNASGSPANGFYDLTFSVWTNSIGPEQVGSTPTNSATEVRNGLFTVTHFPLARRRARC